MFDIEVRFLVGGRSVALDEFVEALALRVAKAVQGEVQGFSAERAGVQAFPWQVQREERKEPKRLAVGIIEAAKMLGISPATVRQYVARGRLRAVRVGRRVLLPVEVLERVMVEGLSAKRNRQ